MKSLILALLIPGLLLAILRWELTAWRLFSPAEVAALRDKINRLEQAQPAGAQNGSTAGGNARAAWIRDPNYRTSLERTQIVGRPEPAKDRDR